MNLFKLISNSEYFKNYISLFLIFFSISNLLSTKADANNYVTNSSGEVNNSERFYYENAIKFGNTVKINVSKESNYYMIFIKDTKTII